MWTALEGVTVGGRYELRAHLATGGMAAVFRGWDHRLARPVAIKVLRRLDAAGPRDVERFRREARAAAGLCSPNIIEVFDFFADQGCYYLVMELVEGISLKRRIADHGPLDFREAFAIAAQVCQGLDATHTAGFIHRDIKPQNILLGDDGSIKLADFGIVHVPWLPGFTTGGIVLGTADYISPEQAQGMPLAPTTDLYSLGVVLYEALTGVLPFTGTTPVAVALRHAFTPAQPPRRLNPRIPPDAESVVLRALRKDPDARYPTARAMEAALRCVLDAYPRAPLVGASLAKPSRASSSVGAAGATGGDSDSDGDTEWRRLTEALLRPANADVSVEAEAEAGMDEMPAAGEDILAPLPGGRETGTPADSASPRLVAAMAMAALLIAGILLLHLVV